jgi:putative ABC transport system permease protein
MSGMMPIDIAAGFYPLPLLLAAGYGALTALAFSLWPLARACNIPAGRLFRDMVAPARQMPGKVAIIATLAAGCALAALAVYGAHDRRIALWFVGGSIAALVIFRIAGWVVMRAARFTLENSSGRIGASFRLALANLHRPGAPTIAVVMSLGLGLTVLVTITLIEGNMRHQIAQSMPSRAPDFFFIDIQPDQAADFDATIYKVPGVTELRRTPILRGRIIAINGIDIAHARIAPQVRWIVRGDRGLTWSRTPPDGTRMIAGKWWPPNYKGKPLISLSVDAARGFGIGVGDTLTVNILGRKVTATVANLREVRWRSLRLNFVVVFSPGVIEAAPQTQLATVRGEPASISAIERAVTNRFANVSAIRVRDVLKTVSAFLDAIAGAIRFSAGVTLLAGALVLAGAIASGHRRRVYDSVVLKVLGATRRDVLAAYLTEYGLLGLATGVIAMALGTAAAWAVVRGVMHIDWIFLPWAALGAAGISTAITLILGFAGAWRALGRKAAPLLRNE